MANRFSQICWASLPAAALRRVLELVPVTQRVGSLHSCALVCSSWSKEAAAATVELTYPHPCDTESLQLYLDSHGSSLQTLDLDLIEFEGAARLSRLPCPMLRSLKLHWLYDSIGQANFVNSISAATHLTSLILCDAAVEDQPDLAALLQPLTKLQHLDLDVQVVPAPGCDEKAYVELPAVQHLQHLTFLKFFGRITDASLQHFGALRQLQHLDLCFDDGSQCTTAAANGLCQLEQLTKLMLYDRHGFGGSSNTDVMPDFSEATATARLTALQTLHILCTYSRFPPALLAGMTGLTALYLDLPWREPEGATELMVAMRQLQKLVHLCIDGLDATAVPTFACSALTASSNLTNLFCHRWLLPADGWLQVFSPLQKLPQLQILVAGIGQLSEGDAQAALEAIVSCCPNLQKFNACDLVGAVDVSMALQQLSLLTHLTVSVSSDAVCGALAQLTCLQVLGAKCLEGVTLAGLRQLAALTQLTLLQLGFDGGLEGVFPQQPKDDDDVVHPCCKLVLKPHWTAYNTTPEGELTLDVWLQLLMACTQAARALEAEELPLSDESASVQGSTEESVDEPSYHPEIGWSPPYFQDSDESYGYE